MLRDQYKIHQTKKDLENQLEILKFYTKFFKFAAGRSYTEPCYPIDGEVFRKGETHPAEVIAVKDRRNLELHEEPLRLSVHLIAGGIFNTTLYSVDCHPIDVLIADAENKNVPAVLVVRFMGKQVARLGVCAEYVADMRTAFQKPRGDRQEAADLKYFFPISDFYVMRLTT